MEHYGRYLAAVLLVFAIFGGYVAYGLKTGTLPGKKSVFRRDDNPAAFYFLLIFYACIALLVLCVAFYIVLLMVHHRGPR